MLWPRLDETWPALARSCHMHDPTNSCAAFVRSMDTIHVRNVRFLGAFLSQWNGFLPGWCCHVSWFSLNLCTVYRISHLNESVTRNVRFLSAFVTSRQLLFFCLQNKEARFTSLSWADCWKIQPARGCGPSLGSWLLPVLAAAESLV
jgi:hypothetical protein